MRIIADLQIHSKHARATSKNISIENLEKYARIKGLSLLGTGDFQHPLHRKEIDEKLSEDSKGILRTKNNFPFIWQTEVSLMFSQGGKKRAVHLLIFSPNTITTNKITSYLATKGRLDYDGRPIFGIPCSQLVKDLKSIHNSIEIIPAHCMTPWFGLFGSDSGFDSIEECFQDQTKHIHAIESGMSANPKMLWRLKEKINIVSFSDAHSFWPWRLGREATSFDLEELTYTNIITAIRTGNTLTATIETPPSYGKYHYDGHRNCNFSSSPEETKSHNAICPICKNPLTIGVQNRIEQLAKAPESFTPENAKPFHELIPLHELIATIENTTIESKKTWQTYNELIEKFNNELNILLNISKEEMIKNKVNEKLTEIILLSRKNKLKIKPGFDGQYGIVQIPEKQATLF